MKFNEYPKWWVLVLVLGFLASGRYWMDQQDQRVKDQISGLQQENEMLVRRNEQLSYINDLAVEFSMDPTIVTLVDRYSREYMRKSGPEWRLVRTPEFMSYIMLSLIYVESKGNTHAVGDGGRARGLTQIWVSTAQDYGAVTSEALHLPETNLSFAFKHFHQLLKKYQGNITLTLYAWNRGSRKVDRLLEYGESPGNGYARKVYEVALLNNRELLIGTPLPLWLPRSFRTADDWNQWSSRDVRPRARNDQEAQLENVLCHRHCQVNWLPHGQPPH